MRRYLWDGEVIPFSQTKQIASESEHWFARDGTGLWLMRLAQTGEAIGFCGYWRFRNPPELELLYGIADAHWSRGFATEAASAMLRYGFNDLRFERIVASTDAANTASVRILEKIGMRFDRQAVVGGMDTVFYAAMRPSDAT